MFAKRVIVSSAAFYSGKGSLHYITDKANVNVKLCTKTLLPRLIEGCKSVSTSGFIFMPKRLVDCRLYCQELEASIWFENWGSWVLKVYQMDSTHTL